MINREKLIVEFEKQGNILKTSELRDMGFSSRQITRLMNEGTINKLKFGYYELSDIVSLGEVVIAKLFPQAVIFLESALMHYGYTDRIPSKWQIAVNKNSEKSQYRIENFALEPYYIEPKFIEVGIDTFQIDKVTIRIYNRERTICDLLRYEKKLEKEVFSYAIQAYIKDQKKNIRKLFEYAEIFNIKNKAQIYIGVWL